MPLVKIEIIKGKPDEYKKKLLSVIHIGLVNALQIEDWDRFQRLYELDDAYFERSEGKSDCFTMIEITMFPGRTKEQKAKVYQEITQGLYAELGIAPSDVFIVIEEPPYDNWGIGGIQRKE